jgi:hypothetical protein
MCFKASFTKVSDPVQEVINAMFVDKPASFRPEDLLRVPRGDLFYTLQLQGIAFYIL